MFKVIKVKHIVTALTIIVILAFTSININTFKSSQPSRLLTVIIDAGHGGRDNGCEGNNKTKESIINLQISKELEKQLSSINIKVIMTRKDNNGLYESNVSNYKKSDMINRLKIINNSNADLLISIHQNAFADKTQCGAQAFFQKGNKESELLATFIQEQLKNQIPYGRENPNFGDYYILKESNICPVLVECGFLSNTIEEQNLNNKKHQQKIAYAITCGIIKYITEKN